VTAGATPVARGSGAAKASWGERVPWLASIAFCGVLPALVLILLFAAAIDDGSFAIDFRPFHRAAEAVLAGKDPYPGKDALLTASGGPYVYPPLPALLSIPLAWLSADGAGLVVMSVLVAVALSIPWVLGVRDWRCYGIFLLWPPVLSAIQTGNVTLWLALASALVWRHRDRQGVSAAAAGVTLAVKFLLWPLLVWFVATRRLADAVLAASIGAGLLIASWAVIGFDGMRGYPDLLRRLDEAVGDDAYTLSNLVHDLGAPQGVARTAWLVVGLALLVACAVLARRGDERSAFILALAAALALTPLVWLHYFALLVVCVAVARPRLGLVWFVPLATVVANGSGNPARLQTAAVLGAAALTVALALRESRKREAVA
jgi:hypothetical protein